MSFVSSISARKPQISREPFISDSPVSPNSNDPSLFPPRSSKPSQVSNERGQGLIEYLIIVALIAVATIGVMRVLGQAVTSRFATVSDALQGTKKTYAVDQIDDSITKKKDLGDFMNGVESRDGARGGGSR